MLSKPATFCRLACEWVDHDLGVLWVELELTLQLKDNFEFWSCSRLGYLPYHTKQMVIE